TVYGVGESRTGERPWELEAPSEPEKVLCKERWSRRQDANEKGSGGITPRSRWLATRPEDDSRVKGLDRGIRGTKRDRWSGGSLVGLKPADTRR
ncbi:hypothetical protein T310_8901, partial [Rasamsonia emersonii CBS 393.64]